MKRNTLTVEHPQYTVGELIALSGRARLTRSTHLGNTSLRRLVLLTSFPVRPVIVDTIHGRDRHARPYELHIAGQRHRLASDSQANDRVIGAVPCNAERLSRAIGDATNLSTLQTGHASVASLHQDSLQLLRIPGEAPMTLTEAIAKSGDVGQLLMESLVSQKQTRRIVEPDGKIRPIDPVAASIARHGIYGQADATAPSEGLLPPLQGMMAFELLEAHLAGEDTAYHLAGADTARYTLDAAIMNPVEQAVEATLASLGSPQASMCYRVIDTTGIAAAVTEEQQAFGSQYDLIAAHANQADRYITIEENAYALPTNL